VSDSIVGGEKSDFFFVEVGGGKVDFLFFF